jgi:hypothetical protein
MRASASKISTWRRCQKKAYFLYVLKIARVVQSIAPSKGSIIHACLYNYYTGKDWTLPIKALNIDLEKVFEEEREAWIKLPEELYRIVNGYIKTYLEEDKHREVIAAEQYFEMELGDHIYEGYIDKIDRDSTGLWSVDYKTASKVPDVTQLYMDIQTAMYAMGISRGAVKVPIKKGERVGILFDHISTKAPRTPALLKSGAISRAAIVTDVTTYMDAVKANGHDPKDYEDMIPQLQKHVFYRRAAIPIRKTSVAMIGSEIISSMNAMEFALDTYGEASDMYPRTFLSNRCEWDCPYYTLCVSDLLGMNTDDLLAREYEPKPEREDISDGEED